VTEVGYSGTPLPKKLGVKEGSVLALFDAPPTWSVAGLPAGVDERRASSRAGRTTATLAGVDVAVAFCRTPADVDTAAALAASLPKTSALWLAWPRKAGGHVSDVDENLLRLVLLPVGVVGVNVGARLVDW
jgi:hypothetical protein